MFVVAMLGLSAQRIIPVLRKRIFRGVKPLVTTETTLINPLDGYARPRIDFQTTTTIWRGDELIKRRVRDWMRLIGEDGYSGVRESVARKDLTIYTGTYSVFPLPVAEWIYVRYAGPPGNIIIDGFSGGPPRGIAAGVMGYEYHGIDLNQDQIDQNEAVVERLEVENVFYYCEDALDMIGLFEELDIKGHLGFCSPPYHTVEVYSDDPLDLSVCSTYDDFDYAMQNVAHSYFNVLHPGAFMICIAANFRDKKGELIDFRGHTVRNFQEAGFLFWQDIILSKNFGSAAKRSTNAWRGKKLVPRHEHIIVMRMPGENNKADRKRVRI